jgi:hypothetical protein
MEYTRLTKRDKFGVIALCNACPRKGTERCTAEETDGMCCINEQQNRLAELEDKIEQGTLIELPILDEDILEDYAHRMFDSWNDITGAIHNGCSWYCEVLSVIDDIVGMVYGITKRQAEKRLKELQE